MCGRLGRCGRGLGAAPLAAVSCNCWWRGGGRGRRPLLGGSVSRETVARPGPGVTNTAPASRPVSTSQPPAPAATAGDTGEVEQGRGQGAGGRVPGAGGWCSGAVCRWGCDRWLLVVAGCYSNEPQLSPEQPEQESCQPPPRCCWHGELVRCW